MGNGLNAQTKEPVPFAKVVMRDKNLRIIDTKITDPEGRFGFLISPESFPGHIPQFTLEVTKKGFAFPSQHIARAAAAFAYKNIYHGDIITAQKGTEINYDIPIDPDQQQAATKAATRSPRMALHNTLVKIADIAFWISIVVVPITFILDRSWFNFFLLLALLIVNFFRIVGGLREKPYGLIVDRFKKTPMPYALVTLNDAQGRRKAFAVTNELGKYILISEKGAYTMSLATQLMYNRHVRHKRRSHQRKVGSLKSCTCNMCIQ